MRLAVRTAWLFAYALWAGGFCFYAGVVVHLQQARLPEISTGDLVTREVAHWLNGLGVATLLGWWAEWSLAAPRRPRGPGWLLAFATLCQLALLLLHGRVGGAWDDGAKSFYRWHQAYLGTHTALFLAQAALLPLMLKRWREQDRSPPPGETLR